jgi:hypothetical protein
MPEPPPDEPKERHSFWTTLPGILTGITGVVAAVAGVLAIIITPNSSPESEGPSHSEWARKANRICSQSAELIRHMPPLETNQPRTFEVTIPAAAEELRKMTEGLRALPAPEEDEVQIDRLASILEAESNEADSLSIHWLEGDLPSVRREASVVRRLERESKGVGHHLGVGTCTQTLHLVGY